MSFLRTPTEHWSSSRQCVFCRQSRSKILLVLFLVAVRRCKLVGKSPGHLKMKSERVSNWSKPEPIGCSWRKQECSQWFLLYKIYQFRKGTASWTEENYILPDARDMIKCVILSKKGQEQHIAFKWKHVPPHTGSVW
jgi:hypothetical protein